MLHVTRLAKLVIGGAYRLTPLETANLFEQESEWDAMDPAGFVLEVEHLNELAVFGLELFLRYPFSNKSCVVIDADDWIVSWKLARKFVAVGLVNSNLATLRFVRKLGFGDEGRDQILNIPAKGTAIVPPW